MGRESAAKALYKSHIHCVFLSRFFKRAVIFLCPLVELSESPGPPPRIAHPLAATGCVLCAARRINILIWQKLYACTCSGKTDSDSARPGYARPGPIMLRIGGALVLALGVPGLAVLAGLAGQLQAVALARWFMTAHILQMGQKPVA